MSGIEMSFITVIEILISVLSIGLCLILTRLYLNSYKKIKISFTLGLLFFSLFLLLGSVFTLIGIIIGPHDLNSPRFYNLGGDLIRFIALLILVKITWDD
ncbi:MAG: hypothetical protein Q4Q23_06425 [Methanobacteriaceae archaeon]|nr:hypothetical protein [Methanobacteriaceae archaeon]